MNGWYIGTGILLFLLLWQAGQAEHIETTIASEGASFLSSSFTGEDQTYARSVFTTDQADLSQRLVSDGDLGSVLRVTGSGVLGVDEYAFRDHTPDPGGIFCILGSDHSGDERAVIRSSGLFSSGAYVSVKELSNESTVSRTGMNGSGQVILTSRTTGGNGSGQTKTYAAGPVSLSEIVRFGEDDG